MVELQGIKYEDSRNKDGMIIPNFDNLILLIILFLIYF